MYVTRTHGSVRGMMLDLIVQHHPTRFNIIVILVAQCAGEKSQPLPVREVISIEILKNHEKIIAASQPLPVREVISIGSPNCSF